MVVWMVVTEPLFSFFHNHHAAVFSINYFFLHSVYVRYLLFVQLKVCSFKTL